MHEVRVSDELTDSSWLSSRQLSRWIVVPAIATCLLAVGTTQASAAPAIQPVADSPFGAGSNPAQIVYSPDGHLLAVPNSGVISGAQGTISMYQVEKNGGLEQVNGSPVTTGTNPFSAAFSPNGKLLVDTNSGDNTLSVFAVSRAGKLTPIGAPVASAGVQPVSVAFSPDGHLVAVANVSGDGSTNSPSTITIFRVMRDGQIAELGAPIPAGHGALQVRFSPNGRLLATANMVDGTVSMFSVGDNGTLAQVPGSPFVAGAGAQALSFSPNGRLLATADNAANTVSVFTVGETGTLSQTAGSPFATGGGPASIAFSADGRLVATANSTSFSDSVFSVSNSGGLTQVSGSPIATGKVPVSVGFEPGHGYTLATANTLDNTVSVVNLLGR